MLLIIIVYSGNSDCIAISTSAFHNFQVKLDFIPENGSYIVENILKLDSPPTPPIQAD